MRQICREKMMGSSEKYRSLQLVFDEIKGRIAAQDAQITALDGKATAGFGSATLLAAVGSLQQLTSRSGNGRSEPFVVPLSVVGFTLYLVIVFATFMAYRPRDYNRAVEPKKLRDEYLSEDEDVTRKNLVDAMVIAYEKNVGLIKDKANWTNAIVCLLLIQAVVVVTIYARQYGLL